MFVLDCQIYIILYDKYTGKKNYEGIHLCKNSKLVGHDDLDLFLANMQNRPVWLYTQLQVTYVDTVL